MRTAIATHELLPEALDLESLSIEAGRVSISVSPVARRCLCPVCGRGSSRVHSRYSRAVSDLPWHPISVELEVRPRRLFCDEGSCERRFFCERLPDVAAHARKTRRLEGALLAIVVELGGRAGARLANELGLLAGRDALLLRAKRAGPADAAGEVRVCWAWTTSLSVAVRGLGGEKLDVWLEEAEACNVPAMRNFGAGLKKDLAAVRAGL